METLQPNSFLQLALRAANISLFSTVKISVMNLIEQINNHKYLYLDKLVELNDLELEVWISEARVDYDSKENLQDILEFAPSTEMNSIISDDKCKSYKILFKNYIAFSVRNETFTNWDDEEKFDGDLFRRYSKSKFLDYVESSTSTEYAKFFMAAERHFHIGICCLNHIIDVACLEEPIIEELN